VDRKSGKAGVLAPTTHLHLHLPQRHPRPVHVQAKVTTTGSPDRMEFHQNVSCRSNDGTKAEERGAAFKGSACARTVGDSEPPAIAAAERKLGHSFACGAGGGLITQLKGVTGR